MKSIVLIYVALWAAGLLGWVLNIVKLVHVLHDPITVLTVARIVGVFAAPLGAVLGYVS